MIIAPTCSTVKLFDVSLDDEKCRSFQDSS